MGGTGSSGPSQLGLRPTVPLRRRVITPPLPKAFLIIEFPGITAVPFKSHSSYPTHATQYFNYERTYMKDRERKRGTDVRKNIGEKTDHESQENLTSPAATYSFFPLPRLRSSTAGGLPACRATLRICLAAAAKTPRGAIWVYSQPRALVRVVDGEKIRIRECQRNFHDE